MRPPIIAPMSMSLRHCQFNRFRRSITSIITLASLVAVTHSTVAASALSDDDTTVISRDGGWCWFEDPRAVVWKNNIIVGSVANGRSDPNREGDIEALVYDLETGETTRVELHDRFQADDHNSPVFCARSDGRLLTVYAKHGNENRFYYRISEENDPTAWGPIRSYSPSEATRLTYSNVYRLRGEGDRIYDFFRGLDDSFKPSYVWSDDGGANWVTGSVFIDVPTERRHRPYVRYASDGHDIVHMIYTEGHPRVYANSVYHIFYRNGRLHRSDGTAITTLAEGLDKPEEGSRLFHGDPQHVAWTTDIELDSQGRPFVAFSVQVDSEPEGMDHRYYYGRWDGSEWQVHEMAHAGSRLYEGENDYTGLVALEPENPDVAYISTDAHPVTGEPLISEADNERHYELFRGVTQDNGERWRWQALTRDSDEDNLRPIVPSWSESRTALIWLRGEYRSYQDYDQSVVLHIRKQ